jgi:anti-sigma B factor antagonist
MTTHWPRPNICVVTLAGELDCDTAPLLAEYLRERAATYLVLDLEAVTFIAAAGINVIMSAQRNDHGIHGQLHVTGLARTTPVARVLRLIGVHQLLHVHADIGNLLDHIDNLSRN